MKKNLWMLLVSVLGITSCENLSPILPPTVAVMESAPEISATLKEWADPGVPDLTSPNYTIETVQFAVKSDLRSQYIISSEDSRHPVFLTYDMYSRTAVISTPADQLWAGEDFSYLFNGMLRLQRVVGLGVLNTTMVRNMSHLFDGCAMLADLDMSTFKTDSVTDMTAMYRGCGALSSLDITRFHIDSVSAKLDLLKGVAQGPDMCTITCTEPVRDFLLDVETGINPDYVIWNIVEDPIDNRPPVADPEPDPEPDGDPDGDPDPNGDPNPDGGNGDPDGGTGGDIPPMGGAE